MLALALIAVAIIALYVLIMGLDGTALVAMGVVVLVGLLSLGYFALPYVQSLLMGV